MSGSGSSSTNDEITIILTNRSGSAAESIVVSSSGTTTDELAALSAALGVVESSASGIALAVDGQAVHDGSGPPKTLGEAGIKNGDMVLVDTIGSSRAGAGRAAAPAPAPAAAASSGSGSGGGGLDFSALLASAGAAPAPAAPPAAAPASGGGGLSFNIAGLEAMSASMGGTAAASAAPVQWPGMSLDDAMSQNPNPAQFVPLLLNPNHPNLIKELNYHNPPLAAKLRAAGPGEAGIKLWREEMIRGGISGAIRTTQAQAKEREMRQRLQADPNDAAAKQYFDTKERKRNVDAQYRQMMEEYPESMGRVLMLYIDSEVNGHPLQAFVDSGAQSTIMSSACAERCELLHLVDERFEGTAVGVGTGKILGRIHLAPLKIGGHFFPCTITVMDSKEGLGDKNMDFLFGLDMLKRHRCNIDLSANALLFSLPGGKRLEAPFLHEKDLDEQKGGTRGFDADKANEELEKRIKEAEEKGAKKEKGGDNDDAMDVDGEDGGGESASKKSKSGD